MIKFENLLQHHRAFSVFWKTILERLSIADAPFFSSIQDEVLHVDRAQVSLKEPPHRVVEFCRVQWAMPSPPCTWKEIKKEHVKLLLLQDFLARHAIAPQYILKLQTLIGDKDIAGEDIVVEEGRIVEIRGLDEMADMR